jgi:acyl-CoA synthetase (AMP-forming)/AMP-acid ligase II
VRSRPDDRVITLDSLADSVANSLARYKLPRTIWLVDTIRRSSAGKPDYPWARKLTQTVEPTESRRSSAGTVEAG